MAHLVDDADKARFLANRILDAERSAPIVGIAVPKWLSEPFVPAADLDKAVGGTASVYVISTGDASWELTYRLPSGLDVYGSALRVWWPGVGDDAKRHDHPLIFVNDHSEAGSVIAQVRTLLSLDECSPNPSPPEPGTEHAAVVTRIVPTGAELELVDGTPAFAHTSHLSKHKLPAGRVVRVGQPVRVQISERQRGRARVAVSLLPFEPDPQKRIAESHPDGSVLEGKVRQLRNFGAFVELLPGLDGLVHKRHISRQWVNHPEEYLSLGDRVFVKIMRTDEDGKIELSMTSVSEEADPVAASIYPDGPPWLPVVDETVRQPVPRARQPIPPEALARMDPNRRPEPEQDDPEQQAPDGCDQPEDAASPAPTPLDVARRAQAEPQAGEANADHAADQLEDTIARAKRVQAESRQLLDDSSHRLARLRSEAAQLRYTIEHELGDLRRRVLETVENETEESIGSTQRALDDARAEITQLREQLAATEQDRHDLLERLRAASARADSAEKEAKASRNDARRQRRDNARLREDLAEALPDTKGLLTAIRRQWESTTTEADRDNYPWREPAFGPEFATSLDHVEGVSRDRVVEVCADVVCRRAPDRPGLEVHALRSSDKGGAPQRVRHDGAKAYRASLQVHTPAARRLHYWELPDGGVELAKIVYHDDFSIT